LDKKEDFLFIQKIFDEFYKEDPLFSYKKVIEYLKKDPEVLLINSGTIRNEGYLKSLKKEE
jgi:spore coat polysaccharide biosynthesis protein SpsF (cytidylyltransferase family)